jgi:hypothetical protein
MKNLKGKQIHFLYVILGEGAPSNPKFKREVSKFQTLTMNCSSQKSNPGSPKPFVHWLELINHLSSMSWWRQTKLHDTVLPFDHVITILLGYLI